MLDQTAAIEILDRIPYGDIPLFARLSPRQISSLRRFLSVTSFPAGETVIAEGTATANRIFIIVDGRVSLCKTGRSPITHQPLDYEIDIRGSGDIFGAMSVLDGKPVAVTVKAATPVTIAILDLKPYHCDGACRKVRNIVIAELRRSLSGYVRSALDQKVDSLRQEAEFSKYRNAVGGIVIAALSLLSFYILALSNLPSFESYLGVNFALSPFIIVFFAAIFFPAIRRSGFPPAFFGLSLHNWRSDVAFSAGISLAFISAAALAKWAAIQYFPSLSGLTVFSFADIRVGDAPAIMAASPWYWAAFGLYLFLTPVQEFVARCGIQAPLYAFLQGGETMRRVWSILVSNLVFSAAHAHISLEFALAAFLPGIFWGWIFARSNSLLAASISHFLIGGAGIFLFGIEEFVERLM